MNYDRDKFIQLFERDLLKHLRKKIYEDDDYIYEFKKAFPSSSYNTKKVVYKKYKNSVSAVCERLLNTFDNIQSMNVFIFRMQENTFHTQDENVCENIILRQYKSVSNISWRQYIHFIKAILVIKVIYDNCVDIFTIKLDRNKRVQKPSNNTLNYIGERITKLLVATIRPSSEKCEKQLQAVIDEHVEKINNSFARRQCKIKNTNLSAYVYEVNAYFKALYNKMSCDFRVNITPFDYKKNIDALIEEYINNADKTLNTYINTYDLIKIEPMSMDEALYELTINKDNLSDYIYFTNTLIEIYSLLLNEKSFLKDIIKVYFDFYAQQSLALRDAGKQWERFITEKDFTLNDMMTYFKYKFNFNIDADALQMDPIEISSIRGEKYESI
jgi:hypothetical protein